MVETAPMLMSPADLLPHLRDALQGLAYFAAIVLVGAMVWQMRGLGRTGNRIQLDLDLQVFDLSANDLVGELIVVLQNVGQRHQDLRNLFIELRPSRQASNNTMPIVPPVNMIAPELHAISLAPGVRQLMTWTFEIPREIKLLRATAVINTGRRLESEGVPSLSQPYFAEFGSSMRYTSRVFEVAPGLFKRF
jgi:hypothetical protein